MDGIYRKSKSVHSRHFYSFGIRKLKEFCGEKGVEITQQNLYDALDQFVAWLDSKDLKPKTVVDYTSAAKRFIVFCGLEIDEKKLRTKVSMPRVTKIAEEPLKIEHVQRLVSVGKPNPRMRALILMLLSSGMRLAEALSLRVKDINLEAKPARATLRAEMTKGKGRAPFSRATGPEKQSLEYSRRPLRTASSSTIQATYGPGRRLQQ